MNVIPEAPPHLSVSAREAWQELQELNGNRSDVRKLKPPALEAAAVQMGRMRDAQKRIDEEGLIIADPKGNPIPHPALSIERAAHEALRKWL